MQNMLPGSKPLKNVWRIQLSFIEDPEDETNLTFTQRYFVTDEMLQENAIGPIPVLHNLIETLYANIQEVRNSK